MSCFSLLVVSFDVKKGFNFDEVQFVFCGGFLLFSFCFLLFIACAFGVIPKKSLPNPVSCSFYPMAFSKCFIVLALIFRSLIYFELIFCMV